MNHTVTEASCVVALEEARQKNQHSTEEALIQSCALKMVEIVLGNGLEKTLAIVLLSNGTVERRISDTVIDIKSQVAERNKSAALGVFSIQFDESTDMASCSQLLVFARHVHSGSFKEELLFCSLETTAKALDILENIYFLSESENLL